MEKRNSWKSRAISLRGPVWQSAVVMAVACAAAPLAAVPGGRLGTLEPGRYTCEHSGVAGGPAGHHVPEADFRVGRASDYEAGGAHGNYLMTGETVVMTSGPHKGQKFVRQSRGFLRKVGHNGKPGDLRCVLAGR